MSFVGFHMPAVFVMPDPDGSDFATDNERAQMLWLYHGINLEEQVGGGDELIVLRLRSR